MTVPDEFDLSRITYWPHGTAGFERCQVSHVAGILDSCAQAPLSCHAVALQDVTALICPGILARRLPALWAC